MNDLELRFRIWCRQQRIRLWLARNDFRPRLFDIHRGWGDHVEWFGSDGFDQRSVWGHSPVRPRVGDYLVQKMKSGKTAVFRFRKTQYPGDPQDMFFGDVEDVGYFEDVDRSALRIPKDTRENKAVLFV